MDDMLVRPVYPRRNLPGRRRKKHNREKNRSGLTIKLQIAACIILLLSAGVIKEINSPLTNFLTDKVKLGLEQNIEIDGIFAGLDGFVNGLKNDKPLEQVSVDTSVTDVPASAEVYDSEANEDWKIDYGGVVEGSERENKLEAIGEKDNTTGENNYTANENDNTTSGKNSTTNNGKSGTYSFAVPVSGVIGSNFGERVHPIKGTEQFHNGIDIKANEGVPIKAALDGEVIEAAKEATYGNFVEIKHEGGLITIYAHCSVLMVKRGQNVKKGQIIAKVGSTGSSTGPHLHFEVWKNGNHVDPSGFVKIPSS